MRWFTASLYILFSLPLFSWGFHAHRLINRNAVYTLPSSLIGFYKQHIEYITEQAVNPDRRRYAVMGEAPKHYIDLDHFGTYPFDSFPKSWSAADSIYSTDTLLTYGILPWNILWTMDDLTKAFKAGDLEKVLLISADLGHYVSDAFVPLHTTENYNGQLSNQHGIHAFWESRVPETHSQDYSYWVGRAKVVEYPFYWVWDVILDSHSKVDSVLIQEKALRSSFDARAIYTAETRGSTSVRTWSKAYTNAYNQALNNMAERRIRLAIFAVGSIWYTCYAQAGFPPLPNKDNNNEVPTEQVPQVNPAIKTRSHAKDGFF